MSQKADEWDSVETRIVRTLCPRDEVNLVFMDVESNKGGYTFGKDLSQNLQIIIY